MAVVSLEAWKFGAWRFGCLELGGSDYSRELSIFDEPLEFSNLSDFNEQAWLSGRPLDLT